jgi:hypothetical protein
MALIKGTVFVNLRVVEISPKLVRDSEDILHRGSSYSIQKDFSVSAVTINCIYKEVSINPVKSRTHYY